MPAHRPFAFGVIALLLVPGATAYEPRSQPKDLKGTWDTATGTVTLAWTAPDDGAGNYRVYREDKRVAETSKTSFTHTPPLDTMHIYLVTSLLRDGTWGDPAVTAVPVQGCEIVSVSTTWDYPYVHVAVHEECMRSGGPVTYHRTITWTAE